MHSTIYATFVALFLLIAVSAAPTDSQHHENDSTASFHHSPGVSEHSENSCAHDVHLHPHHNGSKKNKDNAAVLNNDANARIAEEVAINVTARAPAPSSISLPPNLPSSSDGVAPAVTASNAGGDGNPNAIDPNLGPLLGGIGVALPVLFVLALVVRQRYARIEQHIEDTSPIPKSEARHVGGRPKMHKAFIDVKPACCDGGRVHKWKEMQVSRFASRWFRCFCD
jgi:hypothetical protein